MGKKHTRTLTGLITDRATKSFQHKLDTENWELWKAHWFKTAEEVYKEFEVEQLYQTAQAIRDIIKFNEDLFKERKVS